MRTELVDVIRLAAANEHSLYSGRDTPEIPAVFLPFKIR
jgi:hypothetical protein